MFLFSLRPGLARTKSWCSALAKGSHTVETIRLRTNGVNTNGVTAKVLFFDGFEECTNECHKSDGF